MTYAKQPFHNLDEYIGLPRVAGLALSPDGTKLVTTLSTLRPDQTKYSSALWQLDPQGKTAARRLTFGENGESQPSFSADGDLFFLAKRGTEEDAKPEAWRLPAAGGEARSILSHPAGIGSLTSFARNNDRVLVCAAGMPRATDLEHEAKILQERKTKKITAILHTGYPVRYWDADLGPQTPHFYTAALDPAANAESATLKDLTPSSGVQQTDTAFTAADNGEFLITEWLVPEGRGSLATGLMRLDLHSGAQEMLLQPDETYEYTVGKISPDSSKLIYARWTRSTPQ
ncbi:TolB family protein, partial [Glutamicibacter ardleyensis]